MPRGIPSSRTDTTDLDVGQKTHIDMPAEGLIDRSAMREQAVEPTDIVAASGVDEYAKELAFYEEPVEIEVHESSDRDNPDPIVDLYCQGVPQRIIRGQPIVVKRKYVQILANARQVSMSTEARVDNGEAINRVNKRSALRYPFSVIHDANPRGRDWLRQALRAA